KDETVHLEPNRPYRDYIAWLSKQDLSEAEGFWRQELKGIVTPTSPDADQVHRTSPAQAHQYGEQQTELPAEISAELQSFVRRRHMTLNTLVQGAWALLLSRYSGEDDVIFGTVVSGRPTDLPGVEAIIGNFINTLPVRVRVLREELLLR